MRKSARDALTSPDRALDPLRNRIAELHKDGHAEGFISTRVETRWHQSAGQLWWKRWTNPYEVLVFDISWVADEKEYLCDDGVGDSGDRTVRELLDGAVKLYGDIYELRWLSGDELAAAEESMGVAGLAAASKPPHAR